MTMPEVGVPASGNLFYLGVIMVTKLFIIIDSHGYVRFVSYNWPMTRAALDAIVREGDGCPELKIFKALDNLI